MASVSYDDVRREAELRPLRITPVELVDNTPKAGQPVTLGAHGAITCFISRKGSSAMADVYNSLEAGVLTPALKGHLELQNRSKLGGDSHKMAKQMLQSSVFADVRYSGEVLNRGIFLPAGTDLAVTLFPYNGGRLTRNGFTLAEHFKADSKDGLECLMVSVKPPLSRLERTALAKLPAGGAAANVGFGAWCDSTWWDVIEFAAAATDAVECSIILAAALQVDPHVTDFDPNASANELLALRRSLIQIPTKLRRQPHV